MRLSSLMTLLLALFLGACYEVDTPLVTHGVRMEGVPDGVWRRSDGSTLVLRWSPEESAYLVGAGGQGRALPLKGRWLVEYDTTRHVLLIVEVAADGLHVLVPPPEMEQTLLATHGLMIKPGPIRRLMGTPQAVGSYMLTLGAWGGLRDIEHLTWVGPAP